MPLPYGIVECKDLENITVEVLDKKALLFSKECINGDQDGQDELKKAYTLLESESDNESDSDQK